MPSILKAPTLASRPEIRSTCSESSQDAGSHTHTAKPNHSAHLGFQ